MSPFGEYQYHGFYYFRIIVISYSINYLFLVKNIFCHHLENLFFRVGRVLMKEVKNMFQKNKVKKIYKSLFINHFINNRRLKC